MRLDELIPDVDVLVLMSPEELAAAIVEVLAACKDLTASAQSTAKLLIGMKDMAIHKRDARKFGRRSRKRGPGWSQSLIVSQAEMALDA